ncbi:MAG: type IV pilus secretin PilQ [Candidatus Omnitrophota bacterium]
MKISKSWFGRLFIVFGIAAIAVFSLLAAENAGNLDVSTSDEKPGQVSIDFKDAEIETVLRVLSAKSGVNIVAGKDVTGPVTIRLVDVPWEKALDVILRTYGYAYERESNIIRVTTIENLAKEDLTTQVFPLNYAKAQEVSSAVEEMLTERGKIKFDERTNLLIVTDIPTNIYKIEQVVKSLDSQTPQVEIEAKIIETTLGKNENMGIDWQTQITASGAKRPNTFPFTRWGPRGRLYPVPEYSATINEDTGMTEVTSGFAFTGDLVYNPNEPFNFSAFPMTPATVGADGYFNFGTLDFTGLQATMEFLFSRNDTEVLSNPRITTLNNQLAKITVGTKWPIAQFGYSQDTNQWYINGWTYEEFGILLEVTPVINKDNFITLKVRPEVSDLEGTVSFTGAEVPIISTKEAEAIVMIKDGETLVIGGLIKDRVVNTKRKIPILGDIPILSLFFSKTEREVEKRELLIFLTPRIIKENAQNNAQITAQFQGSTGVEGSITDKNKN